MKSIKGGICTSLGIFLLATPNLFAIEALKLQIHCPDVVLSWPSIEGDTYIVQYRETLSTNTPWVTLTDSLPAETTTNITTFVHSNRVDCPTGQIFGMMISDGGDNSGFDSESKQKDFTQTGPVVMPKGGSKTPVPLEIYPPGFDLSGYIIIWPDGSTDEWSEKLVEAYKAVQREEQDDPQTEDAGGGGSEPGTGFYQVVRVGINLFGINNGTVLHGEVSLPLEFANTDTNRTLSEVFLTDNDSDETIPGSTFPNLPYEAANQLSGVWDTTQVTNGSYMLQVGARLTDGTAYLDHPVTVTVSNVIAFPDAWDVGGLGIYVGAKTIYTNGVWQLDVYDDQNTYLGYLNGPIDSDGYCAYPGITGPGFTLDNTDAFGNQNPSTSYNLVMSAAPTNTPLSYPMATNKVFIEPAWNFATTAVTCHMNPFASWKPGWSDVHQLMETIWNIEEPFHHNLLGGSTTPYEIFSSNDWVFAVQAQLIQAGNRDFFYFGHGSGCTLGVAGAQMTVADINAILLNNSKDPLTATNIHPYRYVFLDGCNTADGNWPQAFGIPKKKGMVITDFTQKRGVRPRAFMGWNRKKLFTNILGGSQLDDDHEAYIADFWDKWAARNPDGTPTRDVMGAIVAARTKSNGFPNSAGGGLVLYGAQDLVIDY